MIPKNLPKLELQPNTCSQLGRIISKASCLEIKTPKPGNVGPSIPDQAELYLQYEYFAKNMGAWVEKYISTSKNPQIGDLVDILVNKMLEAGSGQNLLLGHILLFSPLALSANQLLVHPAGSPLRAWEAFWLNVAKNIRESKPDQTILVGKAIRKAKAGGLAISTHTTPPHRYDLFNPEFDKNILEAGISVDELMKMSAKYDSIGSELSTIYAISRHIFLTWLIPNYNKYRKLENCTLDLYLTVLSLYPDSLISRKTDVETAFYVQTQAKLIVAAGGSKTDRGITLIQSLDHDLRSRMENLNPGTTADLTACILFLGLLFGILS